MVATIQATIAAAMQDVDVLNHLDDGELLATEWVWALRDGSMPVSDLPDDQLRALLIEDLLTIASFEGKGRQLAQTADSMMRFLSKGDRARVTRVCFQDEALRATLFEDDAGLIRLDPRCLHTAMSLSGIY